MLRKNDDITLKIDGMTAEGSGVGRFDGQAVFVRGAAPGDVLAAHIMVAKKTYAVGKIDRIITPSKDRMEPDCPVAGKCGGCTYRHITYESELKIKEQKVRDAFERIGGLNVTVLPVKGAAEVDGYRNKAQFPVGMFTEKDKNGEIINRYPVTGFYAFNTHRIVPQKDCRLQPPVFKDILEITEKWMMRYNISVYEEEKHRGLLRHIFIRQGRHTGEIMVCLVINGDEVPHMDSYVEELVGIIPGLKTVVLNINKENSNVILGEKVKVIYGDGYIADTINGKTFRISPLSFFQVNTEQCEVLYDTVREFAGGHAGLLLDLYCGAGTIGLSLSDCADRIIGVEIIPEAIEDAKVNACQNGITHAEFFCGDAKGLAEKLKAEGEKPDVIVVDPPRKGLDAELPQIISDMAPEKLVYVSCDPATLARDCARLTSLGFTIARVQPVDLFPRTAHVETVALMIRL